MFVRSIAVAAGLALGLFACAGSEPSSEAPAQSDADFVAAGSCGTAAYADANAKYKEAVATAKRHKVDGCGGDNSDLGVLAQQAAAATKACGAFANVIKTSPWAAPIREEMKGNLALAYLQGDLQVKDASGKTTFKGLEAALASGVTLWGPAPGAYGNSKKIEFGANGAAKIFVQNLSDDGKISWTNVDATYKVGAVTGDTVRLTITQGATVADFDLKFDDSYAPDFQMQAVGSDSWEDRYTAYISECDA